MSFVYPSFLWALGFLAVPIIIHLFNFRRYKTIGFTNVKFLKNIQQQSQSVKRLRNFLVLLTRLLAIIFLVLAFAKPFIPINQSTSPEDTVVGIYVDNSFSMEQEGSDGPLIEVAREKARQIVKSYPSTDQFLVFSNTRNSVNPVSRETAIQQIDDIQIEKTSKPVTDAVRLITNRMADQNLGNKKIYLISDFQETLSAAGVDPDSTVSLTAIPLKSPVFNNISIDTAWISSPVIQLNTPITLNVSLQNYSDQSVNAGSLRLDVNGVRKAVTGFELAPNSSSVIELGFTVSQSGWQNIEIALDDQAIFFDDTYYQSLFVAAGSDVYIANGNGANQYLAKLYATDNYFNVIDNTSSNVSIDAFDDSELIVLNELETVSSGIAEGLKQFVQNGGNVVIIPSSKHDVKPLYDLFSILECGSIGTSVASSSRVGKIETEHPLYKTVFDKIPKNIDLPVVQKYYPISKGLNTTDLLQLENGQSFLAVTNLGKGQVYTLACPLNEEWSNFPRHGLFVPSFLKMAFTNSDQLALSYPIDNRNYVNVLPGAGQFRENLSMKMGERNWIPVLSQAGGETVLDAGYDDLEAGFADVYGGDSLLQTVAFNFNRSESVNRFMSDEEISSLFTGIRIDFIQDVEPYISETVQLNRYGKQYWRLCIALTLIFLGFEILLLRFWKSTPKSPKTEAIV